MVATLIAEISERPAPVLNDTTHLMDESGLSSLMVAELVTKLRTRLNVRLRPTEMKECLVVGHLLSYLQKKLSEAPAS